MLKKEESYVHYLAGDLDFALGDDGRSIRRFMPTSHVPAREQRLLAIAEYRGPKNEAKAYGLIRVLPCTNHRPAVVNL